MMKRLICLVLVLALAGGLLPLSAAAAQDEPPVPFTDPNVSGQVTVLELWGSAASYPDIFFNGIKSESMRMERNGFLVFSLDVPMILTGMRLWMNAGYIAPDKVILEFYNKEGAPTAEEYTDDSVWDTLCIAEPFSSSSCSDTKIQSFGKDQYFRFQFLGSYFTLTEIELFGKTELADPVTVTFLPDEAQGGQGASFTYIMERSTVFTLPDCTFTNSNQETVFQHWDIGGQPFNPGAEVTAAEDLTIRAVWGAPPVITLTPEHLLWKNGCYQAAGTLELSPRVQAEGLVILELQEGCSLTLPYGIHVGPDTTLIIRGTGSLHAFNRPENDLIYSMEDAAIGGNSRESCGNIIIDGGEIFAESHSDVYSTSWAAAIGGGYDGNIGSGNQGGSITINGGTVTATTNYMSKGSAIGAGFDGYGMRITINGGTVRAISHYETAIGQCSSHLLASDTRGYVAINGGDVLAQTDPDTQSIGICGSLRGDAPGTGRVTAGSIQQMYGLDKSQWWGIISEDGGKTYSVYGPVVLDRDLTIEEGSSLLVIEEGSSITWTDPVKVTNNGIIAGSVHGTVTGNPPVAPVYVTLNSGRSDVTEDRPDLFPITTGMGTGQSYTLPECPFYAPENHKFIGWKASDSDVLHQPGAVFVVEKDISFTAQWAAYPKLIFEANGGQGTMDPIFSSKGNIYYLPACGFTPPQGKTFAGWEINGQIYPGNSSGGRIVIEQDTVAKPRWITPPPMEDGHYLISSAEQMAVYADILNNNYDTVPDAKLTGDFTLDDSFPIIFLARISLDGNGHTITLQYENTDSRRHGGLFHKLEDGTVSNLILEGTVKNADTFGGICEKAEGSVHFENCIVRLRISSAPMADWIIGGFAALSQFQQFCTFTDCAFTGSICLDGYNGFRYGGAAGFVGFTEDIISYTSCYSTGSISCKNTEDSAYLARTGVFEMKNIGSNMDRTNCFYLDSMEVSPTTKLNESGKTEPKTAAEFAGGQVCFLLNKGTADPWRQNLTGDTVDPLPVLGKTHRAVRQFEELFYNPLLSDAAVTGLEASYTYTGSPIHPLVTLSSSLVPQGLVPEEGRDYVVSYGENCNVSEGGTVTLSPTENSRFDFAPLTGTFAITPMEITLSPISIAEQTYTGTRLLPRVSVTSVEAIPDEALLENTDYTLTYGENLHAALEGTLSISPVAGSNYTFSPVELTFDIVPCPVTVRVSGELQKVYGQEDPALTYEAALLGEDTLTGALTREAGEDVGTYAISLGTLAHPDYLLTLEEASLVIEPRPVTLTVTVADKAYDGTAEAEITALSHEGILPADHVTLQKGKAVFASPLEGPQVPVTLEGFSLTGEDAGNYILVLPEHLTAAITHAWGPWEVVKEPTLTEEGVKQRTCPGCGQTETKPLPRLFRDVDPEEYYADPIAWAVLNEITLGVTDTRFAPERGCLREHVVTFLWRAAGMPEPETTDPGFVDVSEKDYYFKAVCWAVENGIVAGMDKTHFGPSKVCAREHAVTFLWRAAGKPEAGVSSSFADVAPTAYYHEAVSWAVEEGITAGVTSTRFAPTRTCTRGQIVTFLYRYYVPAT